MIKEKESHAEFHIGNTSVSQTAEQLTTLSLRAYKHVRVQAASVTTANGWALDAGEYVDIPVDDPSKIWVIADSNQTAKWLAI